MADGAIFVYVGMLAVLEFSFVNPYCLFSFQVAPLSFLLISPLQYIQSGNFLNDVRNSSCARLLRVPSFGVY